MNSLTSAPLSHLLDDLFAKADAAESPAMAKMPREERERLMHSKTEYLSFYDRI